MSILIILASLVLGSFCLYFFQKKCSREGYLLFVVYTLPLQSLGVTPEAFGSLKVFDVLAYFSFVFFIKDFMLVSKKNRIYSNLFGLLILFLLAGSLNSEFEKHSLWALLSVFPIFIYSRLLIRELAINPELQRKMIRGFLIAFFIGAFFMIMQMFFGIQFTFYQDLNPNITTDEGIRYPGFFGDAQLNALFLAMVSFLLLINNRAINRPNLLNFVLFGIGMTAVLISGGRSAFLGICVGLFFLMIFFGGRVRSFLLIGALACISIIPFLKNSVILIQRLENIGESYEFRSYIWKEAYEICKEHPMLGIGIGNYRDYVGRYSADQYYVLQDNSILLLDQPESGYLKVATETGIFGFIIVLLFILVPVGKAIYSQLTGNKNHLSLLFIAAILCWLVSFNSLYTLSDRRIVILLATFVCFVIKPGYAVAAKQESSGAIDMKYNLPKYSS